MGALTVRLPDSLHEKVRELAEKEGISMNQLVMLAVSEKITRLDADAQFAHLDALERFGEVVAEEEGKSPDEFMAELLDRVADAKPQPGDKRPALSEGSDRIVYQRDDGKWVNKTENAAEASSVHDTQKEAQEAARRALENQDSGEIVVRNHEGKIRRGNADSSVGTGLNSSQGTEN